MACTEPQCLYKGAIYIYVTTDSFKNIKLFILFNSYIERCHFVCLCDVFYLKCGAVNQHYLAFLALVKGEVVLVMN